MRGKASFAPSTQIRAFVHLCVIIHNMHDQCKCSRPGRVGTSLITLSQLTTKAGSVQVRASRTRGKASFAPSIQMSICEFMCHFIHNMHDQCKCGRPGRVGTSLITLSQLTTKAGSVQVRASRTRGKASFAPSIHISKSEHMRICVLGQFTYKASAGAGVQDAWEQASSHSVSSQLKQGQCRCGRPGRVGKPPSHPVSKSEHL